MKIDRFFILTLTYCAGIASYQSFSGNNLHERFTLWSAICLFYLLYFYQSTGHLLMIYV